NLGLGELHSHFIVTDKESRMLSTNQKLAVLAHDNKTSGAWDDELQRMLWAFDGKGIMIHGTVPADRISGLGSAASKNTGNLAGQVPDMSFFPESGKWTDNGITTLPNGIMIQAFRRTIANDSRTGYSMTTPTNYPIAFPNGVWAVLCTKTTYVQIIASCESVTKQGFNVVTVKAVEAPTTESIINFLAIGY
ncbi:gp53-like domain-containing protein, partial [Morganella morganii]|uniref:gp53-like domain-containing protein n=1 Tax=Morganella morganii TaxID=582 RepID=UPI000A5114B9